MKCSNCNFKWQVASEDRIPKCCPYCSKSNNMDIEGEAGFKDINEFLR